MIQNTLRSMMLVGTLLLMGCALPKAPNGVPQIVDIQKGDLQKYAQTDFNEFLRGLPLAYDLRDKRVVNITCNAIRPEQPNICNKLLALHVVTDFMKQVTREMERYCVAQNGYIEDKIKSQEDRKKARGNVVMSCKKNGEDFFGYVTNYQHIEVLMPQYFALPFDVFTQDPYLQAAQKYGLSIVDKGQYFDVSGARANEFWAKENNKYREEGSNFSFARFCTMVGDEALFPWNHRMAQNTQSRIHKLKEQADKITQNIVLMDYPVFNQVAHISSLSVDFFGVGTVIPLKALTKDGHILIFKAKEWRPTFEKIVSSNTNLIQEYRSLIENVGTANVTKDETFTY